MKKMLLAATVAGAVTAVLVICLRKKYEAPLAYNTINADTEDDDYDEHKTMYDDDLGWLHEIRGMADPRALRKS